MRLIPVKWERVTPNSVIYQLKARNGTIIASVVKGFADRKTRQAEIEKRLGMTTCKGLGRIHVKARPDQPPKRSRGKK